MTLSKQLEPLQRTHRTFLRRFLGGSCQSFPVQNSDGAFSTKQKLKKKKKNDFILQQNFHQNTPTGTTRSHFWPIFPFFLRLLHVLAVQAQRPIVHLFEAQGAPEIAPALQKQLLQPRGPDFLVGKTVR